MSNSPNLETLLAKVQNRRFSINCTFGNTFERGNSIGPILLLVLAFPPTKPSSSCSLCLAKLPPPSTCQGCRISLLPASSAELPSFPLSTHPSPPQSLPPSLDTIFIGQIAACLLILLHVRSFLSCCYGLRLRVSWSLTGYKWRLVIAVSMGL